MKIFNKLRSLFRRERLDRDMAEEMRAHLAEQTQRNIVSGMTEDDARAAARRQFGGVAQIQERARDARRWGVLWLENLVRDTGFTVRALRKNPGFTSVVVLTLALGLGVNTALFTWFNAVAFRPLPVRDPEQLFTLQRLDANGSETTSMSYTDFVAYRDHQTVFSGLTAMTRREVELPDADELTVAGEKKGGALRIETVSANYLAMYGVPMALGRPLVAADESSSNAEPVIVLSHRFWENFFGGDPAVIGRTLRLRGLAAESLTIVGVTGPEFCGTMPGAPAGWVPLLLRDGDVAWRTDLKATDYVLTGRLRPGVSREQAAEELEVIANQFLARPDAGPAKSETITLAKASTYLNLTAEHLVVLLPLVCLFGTVFLVSCANASNLILARAVTRQFELAVRGALGATGRRLFSQLMTESLVLGVLGGTAGWLVAAGLLQFVWPWLLDMIPAAREATAGLNLQADHRVFVFTLVVSMLAGAAGGLLPALQVARRNVVSALKQEGSAFGRGVRLSRVRNFLAVGQLALSSALLFTAGLLVHRALLTQFVDVGFDKSPLLTLEVLAPRTYESGQLDTARRQVLERLRALPDVAAISAMPQHPLSRWGAQVSLPATGTTEGRTVEIRHAAVTANYFDTLQLPLMRGRSFAAHETANDRVAVISETAAREFWPDGDALGQSFDLPTNILAKSDASAAEPKDEAELSRTSLTVIGIARDTWMFNSQVGDGPLVYLPLAHETTAAPYLFIRTSSAANRSAATLRQVTREVTGVAPRVVTVNELFAESTTFYRVVALMAGILAGLSLIVAVIGLYGVMSFTVNQRMKEIGIRIALGATPGRVLSGVVFESLRLVSMGAVVGYGLSVAIAMVAQNLLLGVSAFDPVASVVVILFLAGIGIFACWIPVRRASRVDPVIALRAE